MSYHLALAICKVPTRLGPESMEEILRRLSNLEEDPERDTAIMDAVAELDPDAYEEIYEGLVARGLDGAALEEAIVAATRPLAVLWLGMAVETLVEPLVEPRLEPQEGEIPDPIKRLPYDVREETRDGNRYLFSGTVTSGDANESFGLVRLLDASGVIEGTGSISPVVREGSMRCTRCDYEGDETGGFTAMSAASVTAYINRRGECVTWKNAEHRDLDGYTEVLCEGCGMDLGDLTPEDLVHLGGESEFVGFGGRE